MFYEEEEQQSVEGSNHLPLPKRVSIKMLKCEAIA